METIRIDGKAVSKTTRATLIAETKMLVTKGIQPTLAVVLVGDNAASQVYVKHKEKACEDLGIRSIAHRLPVDTDQDTLLNLVASLNQDPLVHGILVQLPLPQQLDEDQVLMAIDPKKDVDGFHPMNVGNLSIGRPGFVSCTPAGIMALLKAYSIDVTGKHCVVVGRSNIVGKPIAMLLTKANGTVTLCHSKTTDLKGMCREADILIAAIGRPNMIDQAYVKPGAVVIDVGINRLEDGKLCGDVAFDAIQGIAGAVTPVPGGVGPMTITMLMHNCIVAAKIQNGLDI